MPPATTGEPAGEPAGEAARLFAAAAALHQRGKLDEAVRGYTRVLQLDPRFADAYNNMGVALRARGKFEAAVACYARSLALRPDNPSVYSNMGNALRDLGRYAAAAASHQQAVKLQPNSAQALYNLSLVLRDLGHLKEALACIDKALALKPDHVDAHWDRALFLLQMGDYARGFPEYEWRWKLPTTPRRPFTQPRWNGEDLAGRAILLYQEQGFGDMIQFVRYAPLVKERGGTVVVECPGELARLFATVPGVDKVVIAGGALPEFAVQAPILSLPAIFGTALETVPTRIPYLAPPQLHNVGLPVPAGTRLKVGIAWAGKESHKNDRNRSCALRHFVDLMSLPGVAFYSLQKGKPTEQIGEQACAALVVDVGSRIADFADTAAVIQQLDLVVAVDTGVVHLAGALGRPVWTVLPFAGDWRWLVKREDSPWYPTMRLFRQERPQDWTAVFHKVRAALLELVRKPSSSAAG